MNKLKVNTATGKKVVEYSKEVIGNKVIYTIDNLCYKLDKVYSRQGSRGEFIGDDGMPYLYNNKGEKTTLLHNGFEFGLRSDKSIIEYLLSEESNRFRYELEFINTVKDLKSILHLVHTKQMNFSYFFGYEGYYNDRIVSLSEPHIIITGNNKHTDLEFNYIVKQEVFNDYYKFMSSSNNDDTERLKKYIRGERLTDILDSIIEE
ncbi:hypothetical protein [Pontibacter sp. H249]|uniref:hypothetical protein n=1 Tax=Pontibacter sp. H249 TaxID=3133420 RepID=UPI0030BBEAD1